MYKKNKSFKLPERWTDYTPFGEKVQNTCFLPFKVPLRKEILERNRIFRDSKEWFTPEELMKKVPQLKLVIDLTFTDRYYDVQTFKRNGILHKKIYVTGGGLVPSQKNIYSFFDTVDNFLNNNGPDYIIGVHCTHGLNRTGYFICKYMSEKMGILPEEAIRSFEIARGHKMYRENFIEAIMNGRSKASTNKNQIDTNYRPPPKDNFTSEVPKLKEISDWRANPTSEYTDYTDSVRKYDASRGNYRSRGNYQNRDNYQRSRNSQSVRDYSDGSRLQNYNNSTSEYPKSKSKKWGFNAEYQNNWEERRNFSRDAGTSSSSNCERWDDNFDKSRNDGRQMFQERNKRYDWGRKNIEGDFNINTKRNLNERRPSHKFFES